MWVSCVLIAGVFIMSMAGGIVGEETPGISSPPPNPFEVLSEIHPGVWVGSEPDSNAHFQKLRSLGIQTVISVDGAIPEKIAAARNGITYFHVPIGYDAVPVRDQISMCRVISAVDGPVFIHCHHGRHRAPAAAACLLVASGKISPVTGHQLLTQAGTSTDYQGLYQSVQSARPIDPEAMAGIPLPPPQANPGDAARQMSTIDRIWDSLKALQKNNWDSLTSAPDQTSSHQSLLLLESLSEYHRFLGNKIDSTDDESDVVGFAGEAVISARKLNTSLVESDIETANIQMDQLRYQCSRCHSRFRNSSD